MKTTVIIPCYNELKTIPAVLGALSKINICKEIIVVDDCSKDGTGEWLEEQLKLNTFPGLRVIKHQKNRGKGGALLTGFEAAQGRIVIIQDADMEYNPEQIPGLILPIESGVAEAVYGSRMLCQNVKTYSPLYLRGNKTMTWFINLLFGSKYTDSYTCYKAFKTSDIRRMNLSSAGFEIEAEISCKAAFMGIRIVELPIVYHPRSRDEGKKINYKDAIKGILKILRLRLTLRKSMFR